MENEDLDFEEDCSDDDHICSECKAKKELLATLEECLYEAWDPENLDGVDVYFILNELINDFVMASMNSVWNTAYESGREDKEKIQNEIEEMTK